MNCAILKIVHEEYVNFLSLGSIFTVIPTLISNHLEYKMISIIINHELLPVGENYF